MVKKYNKIFLPIFLIFALGCSPAAPTRTLNPIYEKSSDATESFNPQVDILFVVDNSGSMMTHQDNFSKNVRLFTDTFVKQNLSYHLGVISSDNGDNGRLKGNPYFVDNLTPNGMDAFAKNIVLGSYGSGWEMFFDPIVSAFQPANLNGPNRDFIRNGAFLVVVFITDAEDQSELNTAQQTFDFLVNLKGNKKYLLGYGVIIPTIYSPDCIRDDSGVMPVAIESFLGLMQNSKNNIMGLCDPNYGDQLARFSKDIANVVGSTIFLNRLPRDVQGIRVTYGTQTIKPAIRDGWSYNANLNAVILGPEIDFTTQPVGTKVQVSYDFE